MRSCRRIACVTFVLVGFLLERDCPISLMRVADNQEANEPFQHIPDVEEDVEHFSHLPGMNAFMGNSSWRKLPVSSYEQKSEEVDCSESLWRDDIVSNYLHNLII